ncbi:MAG TPA: carboxypeptidase regulatory-like domain-containing protein [Thermoanaerobaculia bacterium]|nr:carboxypeptidase regulatory-like domain-containing protein [Thermoanaerobaculia bacterium]
MLERSLSHRCSRFWIVAFAFVLLAAVLAAAPAAAQEQTGDLAGTVRDNAGQPLPGVTVTVSGLGAPRVQVTDAQGGFRFLNLSPGSYALTAELQGFSKLESSDVGIRLGQTTRLELSLTSAVTDTITVTADSPLLDSRQTSRVTNLAASDLESLPTARDPWSLLALTPGVQVDRVNVGGNESGQQSGFLGPGASGSENAFTVDGVVLTDMAAVGGSATYFDFGAFEEVQLTVSSADVTVATAGVTVNQVTKRGTNEWKGEARYLRTDGSLQAEPSLEFGNKIEDVEEYGGNVGGPILKDHLWIWGSWGESDIRNLAPDPDGEGRLLDRTVLKDYNAKLNAQLGPSNSAVAHFWTNDKLKYGRVFTFLGFPVEESTHDQTTPSDIWKLEDTHQFGSSFLLTALWSKDNGDFTLAPKGGLTADMFTDTDNILHGTSFDFTQHAVIEQERLDGNYFVTTGEATHELKFGGGFREQENQSQTVWPQGHNSSAFFYDGVLYNLVRFSRSRTLSAKTEYTSAWLQDTVTLGRWTFAAGLRYDKQTGENLPSVSPENPEADGLIPELRFPGNDAGGIEWKSIVPRLSATVGLGAEHTTLARATFSQYAQQLGQNRISYVNPAGGYSYAYFYFEDANGNLIFDDSEAPSLSFAYTYNIDADHPESLVSTNVNDPELDPATTDEITLGLEHMFRPDFAAGLTATWRNTTDVIDFRGLVIDPDTGLVRQWNRNDFTRFNCEDDDGNVIACTATGELPDGSTRTVPVWGLREDIVPTTGFLVTNGDSEHEYLGLTASFTKRLANRWSARGHLTWNDWNWKIGDETRFHDDPTNTTDDGLTSDDGDDIYTEQSGGAKGDVFVGSEWSFGLNALYQIAPDRPWGFNVVGNLTGREGYGSPPVFRTRRGEPGRVLAELSGSIDEIRNDDVIMLDARIEKEFTTGDFSWLLGVDGFNLLNEDYVLQRDRRTDLDSGNQVRERLSPRVFRVGLTLRFR